MKIITYYECEVCGERFKYEENCQAHELWHNLGDLFSSGAKFYDQEGNLLTIDNLKDVGDFADIVFGIDCPSIKAADNIQEIWEKSGRATPFEDIETAAAPCRIMYNPETYSWFNADEELARIKKQFGEK